MQAAAFVIYQRRSTGRRLPLRSSSLQTVRYIRIFAVFVRASHCMLQGAKDLCLAAADDLTRQRCVRMIEAASASWTSPSDIASSAALTPGLFMMRSVLAANSVLAALGRPTVAALDLPSLDAAGWHVDVPLLLEFGYDAVKAAGCDVSFFKAVKGREKDLNNRILVSFLLCTCTHTCSN